MRQRQQTRNPRPGCAAPSRQLCRHHPRASDNGGRRAGKGVWEGAPGAEAVNSHSSQVRSWHRPATATGPLEGRRVFHAPRK